jgi:PEP-CTERM motif-containing protein
MIDRIITIAGAALGLALITSPVMAQPVALQVPEPATMTLFGLGVAGAFVARKFIKRK